MFLLIFFVMFFILLEFLGHATFASSISISYLDYIVDIKFSAILLVVSLLLLVLVFVFKFSLYISKYTMYKSSKIRERLLNFLLTISGLLSVKANSGGLSEGQLREAVSVLEDYFLKKKRNVANINIKKFLGISLKEVSHCEIFGYVCFGLIKEMGDNKASLEYLRKFIDSVDGTKCRDLACAELEYRNGNFKVALDLFFRSSKSSMIESLDFVYNCYLGLARALFYSGEYDESLKFAELAIKNKVSSMDADLLKAEILLKTLKIRKLRPYLEESFRDSSDIRFANMYLETFRKEERVSAASKLFSNSKKNNASLYIYSRELISERQYDLVREIIEPNINEVSAPLCAILVTALVESGDKKSAIYCLNKLMLKLEK